MRYLVVWRGLTKSFGVRFHEGKPLAAPDERITLRARGDDFFNRFFEGCEFFIFEIMSERLSAAVSRPARQPPAVGMIMGVEAPLLIDEDALCDTLAISSLVVPDMESSQFSRYLAARRFLARLALGRPILIWLDDVQWGRDGLAFALDLLQAQSRQPLPVLLLLTVREEALAANKTEADLLEQILDSRLAARLTIGPLATSDHAALVRHLLGLSGDLATAVADRTKGNPLFAVQLVGDWVQRGVLQASSSGFQLREGERATLPDSIHEIMEARIDTVVREAGEQSRVALEIAAALGQQIDLTEWGIACDCSGINIPRGLMQVALSRQLITETREGWSFAHGVVRESLERGAREAHRWVSHHKACAEMLATKVPHTSVRTAARLGRHYLAAQAYKEALPWLIQGVAECRSVCDIEGAYVLLGEWEHSLDQLNVSATDRLRVEHVLTVARTFMEQVRVDEAAQLAEKAEALANDGNWNDLLARVMALKGDIAHLQADLPTGLKYCRAALETFESRNDTIRIARTQQTLAALNGARGDLIAAIDWYEKAIPVFRELKQASKLPLALAGLADICWRKGDVERAVSLNREALNLFEQAGHRVGMAKCINGLGESARFRGDLAEAESHYRKAAKLMESIESKDVTVTKLNLALVLLAQSEFAQAERALTGLREDLELAGRHGYVVYLLAIQLPVLASKGILPVWSTHFRETESWLAETDIVDDDIAWSAELAGKLWENAGNPEQARQSNRLAIVQWRALNKSEEAARVQRRVIRLEESPPDE